RCLSDWSSDVCSSDLRKDALRLNFPRGGSLQESGLSQPRETLVVPGEANARSRPFFARFRTVDGDEPGRVGYRGSYRKGRHKSRSEERRVGKEGRCGW